MKHSRIRMRVGNRRRRFKKSRPSCETIGWIVDSPIVRDFNMKVEIRIGVNAVLHRPLALKSRSPPATVLEVAVGT